MIEENRNSIIIRNVNFESNEFKRFEKAFSLYNNVTHKFDYSVYTIVGNDVHIPETVTSSLVQTYFVKDLIVQNYAGTPTASSIDFKMLHEPRTDIQREALAFLLSIKNDKYDRHRMLNLATGSGKTFVTISTISELKQRAFIIVDTVDLAAQWKREICFHTDIPEDEVLILSGRESVELAKSNSKYKIFIAIHKTLGMLLDDDLNAINDLMHKLHIGVRVFDECHVNFHSICKINSLSNVNYTILLTATPNRSDYKEDILYGKVFDKVPSYDGHKSENKKYHTIILAEFNSHPTDKQRTSVRTKYGFVMSKWAGFLSTPTCYKYYIDSLRTLIKKLQLVERKIKVAIMLPTIDLIDSTYNDLHTDYPELEIGRFTGTTPKAKRADELSKTFIITNEKMFGKGIDVSDLDCIINYVQLSSAVNLEQIVGRLRNNPGHAHVVVDVTDVGYFECRNQQKARRRFYKKIAKEIKELTSSL